MSSATKTDPAPPFAAQAVPVARPQEGLRLYRLTMEQYRHLGEAQVLGPQDRVFLLDGVLVRKMTKLPPHFVAMNKANLAFFRAMPAGWHVSPDNPVELTGRPSVPEPDFAILRGLPDDYDGRLAAAADVGLLVEISDSSLRIDQTKMKMAYARAGIGIYWIVNLVDGCIEVYTEPTGDVPKPDYGRIDLYGPEAAVPFILDGHEVARIAVGDFLPPSVLRR